jgi:S-(hydroxymethyl)glutathione dehydrogenase/alcohol dehydrogenase
MIRKLPGVVLAERGRPPTLETVSVHEPGPHEVSVRMIASGICHTDLAAVRDARAVPALLGHEGAGIVEQVGAEVTHVRPGDHVVINWQVKCGRCRRCLSGRADLCENVLGTAAPRVYWGEQPLFILLNAGTFCPLVVVPAMGAIPVRRDIPLDKAALLGCAVATGVGAALYTAEVRPGETVAVIGSGGVGLNVIQGARLANAGQIIAIDISDENLSKALQFGATHTINSRAQNAVEQVKALTDGRGVEYVFEVVGTPELMLQGIDMLARGGELILIGAAARDAVLPFAPRRFMSQQQTIKGCIYGNIRPSIDLPLFADWYMDGRLLLDELHSQTVSLPQVPDLFAHPEALRGIRTVVSFEELL